MNTEKRKFTRVAFQMRATVTLADETHEVDKMINLGIGGCLLPLDIAIDPGTPCKIEIFLSGSSSLLSISMNGEVVRSQHGQLAIRFNRIDTDSLFHLQNIVRYNSGDADLIDSEIRRHPGIL